MADTPRRSLAQRVVTAAITLMPTSRRDWGRAIAAELAYSTSRTERARLALAALRIALISSPHLVPGVRDYATTARRAAVLAVIAYAPIGLMLYLLRTVASHTQVVVPTAIGYGYPLLILLTASTRARRASVRTGIPSIAGAAAGATLAALAVMTTAIMGNGFDRGRSAVVILIVAIAGVAIGPLGPALADVLDPRRKPRRNH